VIDADAAALSDSDAARRIGRRCIYDGRVPPPLPHSDDATVLIAAAAAGDKAAAERLLPLVYDQLRKAAQLRLASEGGVQAFSATALVQAAYLELIGHGEIPWASRAYFYAAAAHAMRRLLIERARAQDRRGRRPTPLTEIGDVAALASADPERILAVDVAMTRLEVDYPEAAAVVRLRFYAGLSVDETAKALGMSPRTAARLWTYARAVLYLSLAAT
jgi:RNA polymerase sigma factor (TIGR02999 family)